MATIHIRVVGKVQGVGFRWYVRVSARRLQLSGWVRNVKDGSVEIVASGAEDRLSDLRKLIARGPDGAEVAELIDLDVVQDKLDYPFAMRK